MFLSQSDMHRYLSEYAAKHIPSDSFVNGCRVTRVKLTESGQYSLTWEDVQKATQSEIFDDVIITSGFFSKPTRVGNFERFNGRVMHSSEYTTPDIFAGRTVAVVGASFSSAEIAADVSSTAAVVHNVVPRPSWIIPRYLPLRPDKPNSAFVPVDLLFYQLRADRDGQDRREVLFKSDAEREKTNAYMLSLLGTASNDVLHEV
jgi:cation diffusion facilitator CzcD-associated flavoprotein CzcO